MVRKGETLNMHIFNALMQTRKTDLNLFVEIMHTAGIERSPLEFGMPAFANLRWKEGVKDGDLATFTADVDGEKMVLVVEESGGRCRVRSLERLQ